MIDVLRFIQCQDSINQFWMDKERSQFYHKRGPNYYNEVLEMEKIRIYQKGNNIDKWNNRGAGP